MCTDFEIPKVISKRKRKYRLNSFLAKFLKIIAYSLVVFIGVLFVVGIYYYEHVQYGFRQLKGQIKIISGAQPVHEILSNQKTESEIAEKLQLISKIKAFSKNELGIEDHGNYETFYLQKPEDEMWVVTGCKPLSFEYYPYRFPIAGEFSYKGFFDKKSAEDEVKRLQKEGYDAEMGNAAAWSTLGILKDPILSSMLQRSEASLANLIIHELTHANIFVKNNLSFNENLADFIADKGTLLYLKHHYGDTSLLLHHYLLREADEKVFHDYVLEYKQYLKVLYQSKMNDNAKLKEKHRILNEFVYGIGSLPLNYPKKYFFRAKEVLITKNAFFIDYERYSGKRDQFEADLVKTGSLKLLIKNYKKQYNTF